MSGKDINIFGFNPVKEALENDSPLKAVFIKRGRKGWEVKEIINLCKEKNVPIIFKDQFFFKKEQRNYWVSAQRSPVKFYMEEEVIQKTQTPIIFLYKIQDPQNLGNLFRTISALGFSYAAITAEETAPISDVVSRSSEGALNFLKIINVKKPLNFFKNAKDNGFKIYGGTMEGKPLDEVNFEKKSILILGSEGRGIPEPVKKICDLLISIPLKGQIKSLNVSTAGGILLYELQRRIHNTNL